MVQLKIGEFARLGQVSIRLLRYYDEIGLLKPAQIDEWTGYRSYTLAQLPRLNRILAFKDLGFALEQIGQLLTDDVPVAQIEGMLRLKQMELAQRVQQEQERLQRVEHRLRQIREEGMMSSYEVVIKQVEPQLVASIRAKVASFPEVGKLIDELESYLGQQGMGLSDAAIWHDTGGEDGLIDAEAIAFLSRPLPMTERVKVYTLPAVATMATLVHHGSYANIGQAYAAMTGWISDNGYTVTGPSREIYLHGGADQQDESFITELQFPMEKSTLSPFPSPIPVEGSRLHQQKAPSYINNKPQVGVWGRMVKRINASWNYLH